MDDLLQEFIAETRETLEAIAGEVVAWEADPSDRARLDAIFRFVHTVKGSCGFLDLPRLLRLSHAAEDVLAAVRDGARRPDARLVDGVLAIVDRIGEIVEAIDAGASLPDSGEDALIAALEEGASPAPVTQGAPVAKPSAARSVRLSVDLLDRMMSGMSEMVLARNELSRRLRDERVPPALEAALDRLSTTVADMRDTVTRTRMQRIEALFSALPRIVRDTAAAAGKSVDLVIDGADVELDREMIEMMRDPLIHMIRNAIDHGIESPAERRVAGKRMAGRLTVAARQSGNRIIIEIADDGRGIDTARLVEKAVRADPRRAVELAGMGEAQRAALIFEAGLSSRDEVTALSGRGVGMDVVRANLEHVGGRVDLFNEPGRGLTVAIHVPLTLAILPAVIVTAGDQRFAVPRSAIEEIVTTGNKAIRLDALGDGWVATVRDRRMPLVALGATLGMVLDLPAMLAIVDVPGGSYALGIDAVLDTEEVVIKPAAPAVMAAGVYAGQTLPDSGLPMLMIDLAGLAQAAGLRFGRATPFVEEEAQVPARTIPALLFVDLDGRRRALALDAIDHVEQVPAASIAISGGHLRMLAGGVMVPLCATGAVPHDGVVPVVRLRAGMLEAGYIVAKALDIVALPDEIFPARSDGAVCGVVAYDGEAVELIDPLWILGQADACATGAFPPVCLLEGAESAWMDQFLRPALEGAGYRVVTQLAPGEQAGVRLAMDDDAPGTPGEPRVALSRERGRGIYRFDRTALLSAVASVRARGIG